MLVQGNENKATCSERDLRSLWRHIGQRGQYQLHILSAYPCIQRRKNPNTLEIQVLHTFDSWFFIHLRQASYWCTHRKKMKGVFCWWIDVWYICWLQDEVDTKFKGRWREMTPNCFFYSRMLIFFQIFHNN